MIPAWPFLVGLCISLSALLIVFTAPALPFMRKWWFILACVGGIIYGGIGKGSGFRFVAETGIFDAGSYIDYPNNTIHAVWGYQPYVSGSKFKWFYSYKYGSENKGPFPLPDAAVENCHAQYTFNISEGEECRDMVITCYTEYVAPPTVVTNGVYHLSGVMRAMGDTDSTEPKYVTPRIEIRATIESGEDVILTPKGEIK